MRSALIIATLALGSMLAVPAHAGALSLSIGRVDPSADGFGPATTAHLRYDQAFADLGVVTLGGEVDAGTDIEHGDAPNGRDYGFRTIGAALTARTAGPLYFLGRYGISRNEIDIDGGGDRHATQQRIGVGVGGSLGVVDIELTATRYLDHGDLDSITWLSAGIRF